MFLGSFNFSIVLFIILISTLIYNFNTVLHLFLTAELLWVNLFGCALVLGFISNDINVLALTFFFLVLSAIEFGIGLILLLLQNLLFRSISTFENDTNNSKFNIRLKSVLFINKIRF